MKYVVSLYGNGELEVDGVRADFKDNAALIFDYSDRPVFMAPIGSVQYVGQASSIKVAGPGPKDEPVPDEDDG